MSFNLIKGKYAQISTRPVKVSNSLQCYYVLRTVKPSKSFTYTKATCLEKPCDFWQI